MRIDGVIKSWQRRGGAMHKEVFMITAVVGANWGDEGKGKITDGTRTGIRLYREISGRK